MEQFTSDTDTHPPCQHDEENILINHLTIDIVCVYATCIIQHQYKSWDAVFLEQGGGGNL